MTALLMPHVDDDGPARPPSEWHEAACRGDSPSRWFPSKIHPSAIDTLRRTCWECPVRDDCLQFAIDTNQQYGIWGGMTEKQRRRIRRGASTADHEWDRWHARLRRQAREAARLRHRHARERAETHLPDDTARAEEIMVEVADEYDLDVADLTGRSHERWIVTARHDAIRAVAAATNLTSVMIGGLFDRDHSTILSAIRGGGRTRR